MPPLAHRRAGPQWAVAVLPVGWLWVPQDADAPIEPMMPVTEVGGLPTGNVRSIGQKEKQAQA